MDQLVVEGRHVLGGTEPATARLLHARGLDTVLHGVVGNDAEAALARRVIEDEGFRLDAREVSSPTALWLIDTVGKSVNTKRDPLYTADKFYAPEDVARVDFGEVGWWDWGASSVVHPPYRDAYLMAATQANDAGIPVSCDPNIRKDFWKPQGIEVFQDWFQKMGPRCDLVRMNQAEAEICTGRDDPMKAIRILTQDWGIPLVCVSMSEHGALIGARESGHIVWVPALLGNSPEKVIDATGGGDNQMAGLIEGLLAAGMLPRGPVPFASLPASVLGPVLVYASALASRAIQGRGAFPETMKTEESQHWFDERFKAMVDEIETGENQGGEFRWEMVAV